MCDTYEDFKKMTNGINYLAGRMKCAGKSSAEILNYMIAFDIISPDQAEEIKRYQMANTISLFGKESFDSRNYTLYKDFEKGYATTALLCGSDDDCGDAYYLAKKIVEINQGTVISPDQYLVFLITSLLS